MSLKWVHTCRLLKRVSGTLWMLNKSLLFLLCEKMVFLYCFNHCESEFSVIFKQKYLAISQAWLIHWFCSKVIFLRQTQLTNLFQWCLPLALPASSPDLFFPKELIIRSIIYFTYLFVCMLSASWGCKFHRGKDFVTFFFAALFHSV